MLKTAVQELLLVLADQDRFLPRQVCRDQCMAGIAVGTLAYPEMMTKISITYDECLVNVREGGGRGGGAGLT